MLKGLNFQESDINQGSPIFSAPNQISRTTKPRQQSCFTLSTVGGWSAFNDVSYEVGGLGTSRDKSEGEIKQEDEGRIVDEVAEPAAWNRSESNELLEPCYENLRSSKLTLVVCRTVCRLWAPREATNGLL